jgi:hypothetical protein
LKGTLEKVLSIHRVASHYGVAVGTARRWLRDANLDAVLVSPEHKAALQRFVSERPTLARRRKIDAELEDRLASEGDRKLLARAIVDEFYIHFIMKKSVPWKRWAFTLVVTMYDMPPVLQLKDLMGTPVRMMFKKAKSGAMVPYWAIQVTGYRAFRILQLVRPWLVGQKAYQADIVLRIGPLTENKVWLEKDVYRRNLLSKIPQMPKKVPASGLRESSRTSLPP